MARILVLSYLALAAAFAATGLSLRSPGIVGAAALWSGGLLLWSLAEYGIHRFLFHPFGRTRRFRLVPALLAVHGHHHASPSEVELGPLPVYAGFFPLLVMAAVLYLLVGPAGLIVCSGFVVGYMAYIELHREMHLRAVPLPLLSGLWKHHELHHTRFPRACFGVTTMLWDRLLGTMPPAGDRSR
ncbi:MAG: sterol desaturase family protein [marine benthic group bacterium]|jgi:sterol desaturase/sphingolipid hydroxylase (fatty acid hydroxylase superfamily)|nr:sterol desaturase family protein [Gemmatimonadota bacterium]MCL7937648.1 sterol desaturase family protein [Gemmatimonadota bacterium]MCL7968278.1 sterol desaturase family protein [Gemmatimonadota bacterium]